ncbi:hypothetical protein DXG01_010410 [Tephrocybe rancida]|nr:hypothetical protein DXG01_010410 [Tephrocybe rancida]
MPTRISSSLTPLWDWEHHTRDQMQKWKHNEEKLDERGWRVNERATEALQRPKQQQHSPPPSDTQHLPLARNRKVPLSSSTRIATPPRRPKRDHAPSRSQTPAPPCCVCVWEGDQSEERVGIQEGTGATMGVGMMGDGREWGGWVGDIDTSMRCRCRRTKSFELARTSQGTARPIARTSTTSNPHKDALKTLKDDKAPKGFWISATWSKSVSGREAGLCPRASRAHSSLSRDWERHTRDQRHMWKRDEEQLDERE